MWTLCSLGSNLDPIANTAKTLGTMAQWFGQVKVSPLIETDAVDVDGDHAFLNGLVRFQSELDDSALKQRLSGLEIALGRDRSHPDSKTRARPMDIDILARAATLDALRVTETTPYLDQMLASEAGSTANPRWSVRVGDGLLGQKSATVYFDHGTGQVRVVDQQPDSVQNGIQSAFTL